MVGVRFNDGEGGIMREESGNEWRRGRGRVTSNSVRDSSIRVRVRVRVTR